MFTIQPLNQCLLGVTLDVSRDVEEFYFIDASNDEQVKTKLVSHVDLTQLSDEKDIIGKIEKINLDWETDLMNQLNQKDEIIRASATPLIRKEYGHHCQRACMIWKGVNEFNLINDVKTYNHNHEGIGFVGGYVLMSDSSDIKFEKNLNSISSITLEECDGMKINSGKKRTIIIPSGGNVLEKDYALTGLLSNDLVYLFDLNKKNFVKSFKLIPFDNTFEINDDVKFVPYMEGNRLRSFILQNRRLYELVWKGEEFNSDIILIRHLEWIEDIYSICRIDNFGILFQYYEKTEYSQAIYKPQHFNLKHEKSEGIIIEIPSSIHGSNNLNYAPKSKSLISVNGKTISRVSTLEEIEKFEFHKVSELFNEEEYLKQQKIDLSFKTYQPRVLTDACQIITKIPYNPRITKAYQVKEGRYNEIEIIAGINCKNISKLSEIITNDYIELMAEDLADYLGAPVIYGDRYGVNYMSFIKDMTNLKRSSKSVDLVNVTNGGYGQSGFYMEKIEENKFIGILSFKSNDSNIEEEGEKELEEEEEKEFEIMYERREFEVESDSLIASDPFSERGGLIIKNARNGVWKWTTTHKTKESYKEKVTEKDDETDDNEEKDKACDEHDEDYVDDEEEDDENLIAQLAVIHQDYYDELNNSKLWSVPNNVYRKLDRTQRVKVDDYYSDEIEGGWYVMKLGVGVDVAMAGIFDLSSFYNDKSLHVKQEKQTLLEELLFSDRSVWRDYFFEKMESEGYPSTMAAPNGIITSSGYGDGCYACLFKKSKEGDVIAVRIIYC